MIITVLNKTEVQKSYLGGLVIVPASGQVTIARELNVILVSDGTFISDINQRAVTLDIGTGDELSGQAGIEVTKTLAAFSTDPVAALFLYYSAIVSIRQSATSDAGSVVWAMRNPLVSPYSVAIERIYLVTSFGASTPLSGVNTQRYELIRFSTATPTGGNSITPVRASTSAPASIVNVQALDTGLGVSGLVFEASPFAGLACPEVEGATSPYERRGVVLKLAPGEGLAIRVNEIDAAIGQGVHGEIAWSLR